MGGVLTSNRIQTLVHNNDLSCSYVTHGWPTVANSTLCFVMPLTAPRTFQYNNTSFSSSLLLIQAHKLLFATNPGATQVWLSPTEESLLQALIKSLLAYRSPKNYFCQEQPYNLAVTNLVPCYGFVSLSTNEMVALKKFEFLVTNPVVKF